MQFSMQTIGWVRGGRVDPVDDDWDRERAAIELDDRFSAASLTGLETFSHVEVVYLFDRVHEADVVTGARRPRGRPDWPEVGIFAQRGRVRPNRIGVTICRLEAVDGTSLRVRGLDAVDGTPVLDLKPHMTGFAARGPVVEPEWATEIMASYWSA